MFLCWAWKHVLFVKDLNEIVITSIWLQGKEQTTIEISTACIDQISEYIHSCVKWRTKYASLVAIRKGSDVKVLSVDWFVGLIGQDHGWCRERGLEWTSEAKWGCCCWDWCTPFFRVETYISKVLIGQQLCDEAETLRQTACCQQGWFVVKPSKVHWWDGWPKLQWWWWGHLERDSEAWVECLCRILVKWGLNEMGSWWWQRERPRVD